MPKSAVYEQVHTPLISEDPREYSDMEISFCVNCPQAARITACRVSHCGPPGSSIRGVLQARILGWVAVSFSRASSWSRDQAQVSCTAVDSLPAEPLE